MVDIRKYGIEPFGATPNERQVAHYKIGKKVFFHFGVNTFTSSEWGNGTEVEDIFDPTALDTDQWLRVAKEAGFELAILTVKHHDGFCLWPSAYTEHSVKNSPYKNGKGDVVREFVDSCHKYGLKVGLYISPWDRHSPHWGKDDYNDYFADQLTEILTGYGEIHEVWWDGAGSRDAVYDWDRWESIVRKTQPKAAIFGSMGAAGHIDLRWGGNESGYVSEPHYASIELGTIVDEVRSVLNTGQMGASSYVPSEVDVSIRPGWFYHPDQDTKVKTVSRINKIWFDSVGRNSMMLLSFPPDTRGLVCDRDAENAIASGKCIEKMLSHNYADGADISHGGSQMTVVDEADGEESVVYLADVIDIVLPKSEKVNVFSIG
ncbi:MAG: alpha-L-fucosidase, partial [Clostridia bacterium]|nr:alpha-L-fucosidase [Clostridia bacterium]